MDIVDFHIKALDIYDGLDMNVIGIIKAQEEITHLYDEARNAGLSVGQTPTQDELLIACPNHGKCRSIEDDYDEDLYDDGLCGDEECEECYG